MTAAVAATTYAMAMTRQTFRRDCNHQQYMHQTDRRTDMDKHHHQPHQQQVNHFDGLTRLLRLNFCFWWFHMSALRLGGYLYVVCLVLFHPVCPHLSSVGLSGTAYRGTGDKPSQLIFAFGQVSFFFSDRFDVFPSQPLLFFCFAMFNILDITSPIRKNPVSYWNLEMRLLFNKSIRAIHPKNSNC